MIVDKEDALLESTVAKNSSEYSRAKIRYKYDNISCDPLEAKRFLEKEIGDYFVRNYGTFLMEYYTICPPLREVSLLESVKFYGQSKN